MTTQNAIHFNVSRATGWRDAFVVAFLAIVLGAFVAQISLPSGTNHRAVPVASASPSASSQG